MTAESNAASVSTAVIDRRHRGALRGHGGQGYRPRNRQLQLSRTGMITHTKLSSVLNTPGLTSSFNSKNT